jgi:site-specific recombinase XerD
MAEGAYSTNTLRAQKADGAIFQVFCEGRGESFLPADPKTIRAFIEHEVNAGKKPATVRRGPRLRSRDFGGIDYGFGQSACAAYSDLAF